MLFRSGTTTNALGLSGPNATVTALTATGDIVLQTGSSITVGQVDQQSGLQISDPDNADGQNLISVTAAGRLIIDSPIVNQSAGSIQLTATDHIIQSASTLILTSGSGMISLVAGTAQSSIGADITMQDGAGIVSQQGRIQLHSSGSVRLSSVRSTSGRLEIQAGTTTVAGSLLDNTQAESPNLLTSGSVSLSASGNVGGPGNDEDIDFDAPRLEAVSNFGSLHLRSTGSVRLEGQGLRTLGTAGNIHLVTDAGDLEVAADVQAANAGNIRLEAKDRLTLNRLVASQSGFITLNGASVTASADEIGRAHV